MGSLYVRPAKKRVKTGLDLAGSRCYVVPSGSPAPFWMMNPCEQNQCRNEGCSLFRHFLPIDNYLQVESAFCGDAASRLSYCAPPVPRREVCPLHPNPHGSD